jgi:hypothetical protein
MTNEFNLKIRKQHLVLVLGMVGIAATLSIAAILAFPVQTAVSDHTPDDVDCNAIPCVHSADIVNGQVRTADLATGAVTSEKIRSGGVKSGDILDGDVGLVDLAADSVDSSKIVDGALSVPFILNSGSDVIGSAGTQSLFLGYGQFGTFAENQFIFPSAVTVKDLRVQLPEDPEAGEGMTITVRKNFAATTLTCSIGPDEFGCDSFNSVSYIRGDRLDIRVTTLAGTDTTQVRAALVFAIP